MSLQQILMATGGVGAPVTPIAPTVHTKVASNAVTGTTPSIDTTGSTLLVAAVAWYSGGGTFSGITDSKSNTWTPLVPQASGVGGANSSIQLWYVENPTVGSGHNWTIDGSSLYGSIVVAGFDPVLTSSPFDQQNGSGSTSASTLQPGSITPSADNELIITGMMWLDAAMGTPSIDSGFTLLDFVSDTGDSLAALAYKVQTTATAVNPTWTRSGAASTMATAIASFKHS